METGFHASIFPRRDRFREKIRYEKMNANIKHHADPYNLDCGRNKINQHVHVSNIKKNAMSMCCYTSLVEVSDCSRRPLNSKSLNSFLNTHLLS